MKPWLRITLWYLLFGGLWIFFSDRFLAPFSKDVETLTSWQTLKGWLYVAVSGGLIFFLTKNACDRLEKAKKRRLEVFRKTVRQSHHILLNHLNQMQLFFLEAEHSEDFDKNLLKVARKISEETTAEVLKLENQDFGDSVPPESCR